MTLREAGPRQVALPILALAALCAMLLALPGETITTVYVNDLLIFLDGAHRIASGQVPNRDFHTALGPLTYYLPAAGYWLSGTLGGAMPTGMALATIALALPVAHIASSRLRPVVALPFGAFLLLVVAAPVNLGESIGSLSFAMFYNRIGWAALAALLVMYLQPRTQHRGQDRLDSVCAALLVLVMVYTKVTYGAVALAFLGFMLFDATQRRWAVAAIGIVLVAGLAVEAVWRSSAAHLDDLLRAGRVSGTRSFVDLVQGFLRHLADFTLLGMAAALVLWRSRSLRDLLFFGFCAGPGLLLQSQNSQPWGVITVHAGAAVAVEILLRGSRARMTSNVEPREGWHWTALASGAPFLLLALVLPTALHCALALGLHATLASARYGQSFAQEFGLPRYDRIRLARLWSPGDQPFSRRYLASIRDGAGALESLPERPERVTVLDFANPFSAGLGLVPPRRDSSWLHWERNIDRETFLPPEELFGDVRYVMVPKWGINTLPLQDLYGPALRTTFVPVRETEAWTILESRSRQAGR